MQQSEGYFVPGAIVAAVAAVITVLGGVIGWLARNSSAREDKHSTERTAREDKHAAERASIGDACARERAELLNRANKDREADRTSFDEERRESRAALTELATATMRATELSTTLVNKPDITPPSRTSGELRKAKVPR
jgi:hypothetical protein